MIVQHSGVEPPAYGFQSRLLTVSVRLLCPNSTEDRTPRLLVKQLSRTRNTQRYTQSYIEKRRQKQRHEKIFEEIIEKTFPKMGKEIATQFQEVKSVHRR